MLESLLVERRIERAVVFLSRARADADDEPAAREHVQGGEPLGQERRRRMRDGVVNVRFDADIADLMPFIEAGGELNLATGGRRSTVAFSERQLGARRTNFVR